MKKRIFNPGFEFIFTLAILAVLGLPPLVMAQNTKDLQISITNGDTTVNGKSIKDLSPKERKEALKDISTIAAIPPAPHAGMENRPRLRKDIVITRHSAVPVGHMRPHDGKMAMRPRGNDRSLDRDPA